MRRATPIPAPIDGTVIARKVGPGQYVRNDTGEALYIIADLSTMWLKAQVPENEIPFIRVGQEVEVKVSALPGRVFKARVTAINAATDATTRRVVVRSEIPNPDGALKSEMFASFKIATGADEPSPAVPVAGGDPGRRPRRRLGRGRADAVPAPQGDARDGAGGPHADPRGPQGRRTGRRAAARSSSTMNGGNEPGSRSVAAACAVRLARAVGGAKPVNACFLA